MSAKANPVRIGAFVVGAAALVLVGLIVFGSGQFFALTTRYVAYFEGSVTGLQAGAPVSIRGVPIGQVTSVVVQYNPTTQTVEVPVYFETTAGTVEIIDPSADLTRADIPEQIRRLVKEGLRARLAPLSFVTGQLFIELEFQPDTPAKLIGTGDDDIIEIPTAPSQFQVLETRLESLLGSGDAEQGIKGITDRVNKLLSDENLADVHNMLASLAQFTDALGAGKGDVTAILDDGRQTMARVDKVAASVESLIVETQKTVGNIDLVAKNLAGEDGKIDQLISNFNGTATSITRMADQINNAVSENRQGIADFTDGTLYDVDGLVLDLEQLAQRLNRIADELERDPSGFLFGGEARGGIQ